jgi:NAD(P)-dependent dehydrogenase (short-subunit alcohol dehydrogenase family)
MADLEQVRGFAHGLKETPEILVHCAGGFRWSMIDTITAADVDFLIAANLRSTIHLLHEFIPLMKKKRVGSVILVGAQSALKPGAGMGVYAATKAGVHALVQAVAEEVRESGIRINAVLPSVIDTPANRKDMPDADFSKWIKTEKLAEIIFSLAQDQSKTGTLEKV